MRHLLAHRRHLGLGSDAAARHDLRRHSTAAIRPQHCDGVRGIGSEAGTEGFAAHHARPEVVDLGGTDGRAQRILADAQCLRCLGDGLAGAKRPDGAVDRRYIEANADPGGGHETQCPTASCGISPAFGSRLVFAAALLRTYWEVRSAAECTPSAALAPSSARLAPPETNAPPTARPMVSAASPIFHAASVRRSAPARSCTQPRRSPVTPRPAAVVLRTPSIIQRLKSPFSMFERVVAMSRST